MKITSAMQKVIDTLIAQPDAVILEKMGIGNRRGYVLVDNNQSVALRTDIYDKLSDAGLLTNDVGYRGMLVRVARLNRENLGGKKYTCECCGVAKTEDQYTMLTEDGDFHCDTCQKGA